MATPLEDKSTNDEIRERFDHDVERFSNLETGQQTVIDAKLMMDSICEAATSLAPDATHLLDIGCGAGNNAMAFVRRIPGLNCDLVDLSRPMLDRASERLAHEPCGKVRLIQSDIREAELPLEQYQIVVAASVLGHLRDDADWACLFRKIYQLVAPGGSVWISDMVFHDSPVVQAMMWQRYGDYLTALKDVAYKEKVFAYVDKEDSPRSVTYQLNLLQRVGFQTVEILHKTACFAAFGAIKSSEEPHTAGRARQYRNTYTSRYVP